MSEGARDLLIRGMSAAKDRDFEEARFYLERALTANPNSRQQVDAYYWLSEIAERSAEKRSLLEELLILEPSHYVARRNLAILDGRLDEEDVLNPNQPIPPSAPSNTPAPANQFECPNCGGRMVYAPDGSALVCEYCEREQSVPAAQSEKTHVPEEDFIQALATAKGRRQAKLMPVFECQSCGGSYLLAPTMLSLTCPYCSSVYVLDHVQERETIPPEGLIPFRIDQVSALANLREWFSERTLNIRLGPEHMHGLYLPAWTFDLIGQIPYTGLRLDGGDWRAYTSARPIIHNDLIVSANHHAPDLFVEALDEYDLTALISYSPDYLASWPAETYKIAATDAAMQARWKTLEQAKEEIRLREGSDVRNISMKPANLVIEAYRLILLPAWLSKYRLEGEEFDLFINGQSGIVRGGEPARGVKKLFEWLGGND